MLNNVFFFLNLFKNWQEVFFLKLVLKNTIFIFFKKKTSLFFKVYLNFLLLIKKFLTLNTNKKHFLQNLLIARFFGNTSIFFSKSKY